MTDYQTEHDKDLHLIVVRRDLSHFQYVHPVLSEGSVPLDLSAAGDYRVFAEFTPTGHDGGLVLGADLAVPGTYEPVSLPGPAAIAQVVDGYQATLAGDLVPGQESELTLTVSRDGGPVTDLQHYLAGVYNGVVRTAKFTLQAGEPQYRNDSDHRPGHRCTHHGSCRANPDRYQPRKHAVRQPRALSPARNTLGGFTGEPPGGILE